MSILFHYIYGLTLFSFSFIITKSIFINYKFKNLEKVIFFPISVFFTIFLILTFYLYFKIWLIIFIFLILNILRNFQLLFKNLKKTFFNYNFLLINIILISLCINNVTIVHSPTEFYNGWGLTDTMYGISRTFSYPISYFEFKDLSLVDHKFPIAQSFFGILALPINYLKIFDPFLFISVSVQIYSFVCLYYVFQNYKKNQNISNADLILMSIFVVCSLKFPLYFLENGWKAILIIPLAYSCTKVLINKENFNEIKILAIIFLLVISAFLIKTGIIIVLGLLTIIEFFSFSKRGQLIVFSLGIASLIVFYLSFSLDQLFDYFYQPDSILSISSYKIAKFNLLITLFSLIILRFFSSMNNKIFIFLYSNLIFYFLFPTISVFNLFFTYLIILFYFLENDQIIFRKFIKNKYIYFFIVVFIFVTIVGYFIQNEYFLIYLCFISLIFFSIVDVKNKKIKKLFNTFLIFLLITSTLSFAKVMGVVNMNYQYHSLSSSENDIALKAEEIVDKNGLIFTDLGKNFDNYHGKYGDAFALQLTQSNRQFFLLSFYTDLYNYYDNSERKKIISLNDKVLSGSFKPDQIKLNQKFDDYYALIEKDKSIIPDSFKLAYSNDKYSIYQIVTK